MKSLLDSVDIAEVVAAIKKNTCELSAICEQFLKHSFESYPIDLCYL